MRSKAVFVALVSAVVVLGIITFPSQDAYSMAQSRDFAYGWVANNLPEYKAGGYDLRLVGERSQKSHHCHLCYSFIFEFDVAPDGDESKSEPKMAIVEFEEGYVVEMAMLNESIPLGWVE